MARFPVGASGLVDLLSCLSLALIDHRPGRPWLTCKIRLEEAQWLIDLTVLSGAEDRSPSRPPLLS